MALVEATLILVLVVVLFIVCVAIIALFAWNGGLWIYDQHFPKTDDPAPVPAGPLFPERRFVNNPNAVWPAVSRDFPGSAPFVDLTDCRDFSSGLHSSSWPGGRSTNIVRPSKVESPIPSSVTIVSTPDHGRRLSPRIIASRSPACGVAASRTNSFYAASEMSKSPAVTREDLQLGYASQLSTRFSGTLNFHIENVAAVVVAYKLEAVDICYCFLCLEEVSSKDGGSALHIKPHGIGQYAARIWTVALARFVRAAQGVKGVHEDKLVRPLCDEWQYSTDWFVGVVKACEAPFQRNYGSKLIEAFSQEDIRHTEVKRARRLLTTAGSLHAPRGPRLCTGEDAQSSKASVPALGTSSPTLAIEDGQKRAGLVPRGKRPAALTADAAAGPGKRSRPAASEAVQDKRNKKSR